MPLSTRRTTKESGHRLATIAQMRKEIVTEFKSSVLVEELMEQFFRQVQEEVSRTGELIDEMREGSDYRNFMKEKI